MIPEFLHHTRTEHGQRDGQIEDEGRIVRLLANSHHQVTHELFEHNLIVQAAREETDFLEIFNGST